MFNEPKPVILSPPTESSPAQSAGGSNKVKKFLPSVKALRNQFEVKPSRHMADSAAMSDATTHHGQLPVRRVKKRTSLPYSSSSASSSDAGSDVIEPLFEQFGEVDEELLKPKPSTLKWDPVSSNIMSGSLENLKVIKCINIFNI